MKVYVSTGNKIPLIKATEKVKKVLNISSDLPELQLLTTIIKDYNYLTSRI
jgi:hypothetical protein